MRYTGSRLPRWKRGGSRSNRRLHVRPLLIWLLLWIHSWRLRRLWRGDLVFRMGHLIMRLRGFEIGMLRPIRFHSGRRRHRLRLSIGWNGEASGLHLVGLFGVALVPDCGDFRLLAPLTGSLG